MNLLMADNEPVTVCTNRGLFYVAAATYKWARMFGYREDHRSDDGKYAIMTAYGQAYAVEI